MDHHCQICRVASEQPLRVRALFRVMISGDEDLHGLLDRLSKLFWDTPATAA